MSLSVRRLSLFSFGTRFLGHVIDRSLMSQRAATRLAHSVFPDETTLTMSGTTRKPLPPALKALKSILDALPPEEASEDEMEAKSVKDFTVRVFNASQRAKSRKPASNFTSNQVGVKVFYPKGEIQRESYRTKDGKVRTQSPKDTVFASDQRTRLQKVPQHHWRVYDLIQQLLVGKVTTYKVICVTLREGSPRSGMPLSTHP